MEGLEGCSEGLDWRKGEMLRVVWARTGQRGTGGDRRERVRVRLGRRKEVR